MYFSAESTAKGQHAPIRSLQTDKSINKSGQTRKNLQAVKQRGAQERTHFTAVRRTTQGQTKILQRGGRSPRAGGVRGWEETQHAGRKLEGDEGQRAERISRFLPVPRALAGAGRVTSYEEVTFPESGAPPSAGS